MSGDGQLLAARSNAAVYTFILIAIAVLVAILLLYIVLKKMKKTPSFSEWKTKQKDMPTKRANVTALAQAAKLTEDEIELLWTICRRYRLTNIEYLYKDNKTIDPAFKDYYRELSRGKENDEIIRNLFSLRYKMEKLRASKLYLTSTKRIAEGTEFNYFADGRKFIFTLTDKDEYGCWLKCPKLLSNSQFKPEPLAKINISFNLKQHVTFGLTIRVIRYETRKDGEEYLFFNHNDHLIPLQRRTAKRLDVSSTCTFSAVDVIYDGENKAVYKKKEKSYQGHLMDISCGGCKMSSSMPIKDGQLIHIDIVYEDKLDLHLFGKILRTGRSKINAEYVLHIQFINIKTSVQNTIYAFVYNYL